MELNVGQIHRRTDLHDHYGGQQQGGKSTPTQHSVIFLFTGKTGERYGYKS
jgi:5-methylcytosine-specific restriction protein A